MPSNVGLAPHEEVTLASTQVDHVKVKSGSVVVQDQDGEYFLKEGEERDVAENGAVRIVAVKDSLVLLHGGE